MKQQEKSTEYNGYVINTYFDTLRDAYGYMISRKREDKLIPSRSKSGYNSTEEAFTDAKQYIDSNSVTEETSFKPTIKEPVNSFSKANDKNFRKTMSQANVSLNEIDEMLSETDFTLKKKIFSLAKMEALVFSDPKLTSVYDNMMEDGKERYGYHANETVHNQIFNDYVLNSPKYLQKYKMAVPKKKKRRDKSGINQLRKTGVATMHNNDNKSQTPLAEDNSNTTQVLFLINETDPDYTDVYAYFPNENYDNTGKFKTGYAHVGQHTAVSPDYANESREATPEEYASLKSELEGQGYELEVLNSANESTGAGGAGAFSPALGYEKPIEETTTSASSGAYAGPAAWGGGDLMKGKNSPITRKPIWNGGTVIQENYLTDPTSFNKYIETLNEEIDVENSHLAQKPNVQPYNNPQMNDKIINKTAAFSSNTVKNWGKDDTELENSTINNQRADNANLNLMEVTNSNLITSKEQLKGVKITKELIPQLADQALYAVAISIANRMLPIRWDELPDTNSMWDYIDENGGMTFERLTAAVKKATNDRMSGGDFDMNMFNENAETNEEVTDDSLIDYTVPDWAMAALINGDYSGLEDEDETKLNAFVDRVVAKYGNAHFMMDDIDGEDNLGFKPYNDVDNLGSNVYRLYIRPDKTGEIEENAINEISVHDIVEYVSERNGEEPFMYGGVKWQFVNAKYPDGKIDIGVYRFGHDLTYDYDVWRRDNNINEESVDNTVPPMVKSNEALDKKLRLIDDLIKNDFSEEDAINIVNKKTFNQSINLKYEYEKYKTTTAMGQKMQQNKNTDNIDEESGVLNTMGGQPANNAVSNLYQNLDPKRAIEKATVEYMGAMKQNNKGQSDKIAGNLKSHLEQNQYDWKQDPYAMEMLGDYTGVNENNMTNETDQSMIGDTTSGTMALKPQPTGTVSGGGIPTGMNDIKESYNLLEEINNELDAYSIHHAKLMKMSEDRKPSSLILKDRLGDENKANFKKDLQHSGTKEVIDVEKELMWKDQQTEVGKDPMKLGEDLEANEIKITDAKGKEHLKNVGDSANSKGNEIPKRNLTTAEQDEVNLYRKGMHSLNYDNKPSERFEERMKADMGDAVYEIRQKQMDDFGKQPMYNKEAQPTEPTKSVRTEYNKEKSGWNDPKGLNESMISGRYRDALNKSRIIDFMLNEVTHYKQTSEKTMEALYPLDFTGLGNSLNNKSIDNKISVNEGVVTILDENLFYTDGKKVFSIKKAKTNLTESNNKTKAAINEDISKMKHLLGYKGSDFVNTTNVKKNRGF